jgi:hypothetical protein
MPVYRFPVTIDYLGGGGPAVNVWHLRTDTGGGALGDEQRQGAADALHTFYRALAHQTGGTILILGGGVRVNGDFMTDVESDESHHVDFDEVSAAGAQDYAPVNTALVVNWTTTIAARRGRGRTFLGPLSSTNIQNDGTPTGDCVTVVKAAAQALVNDSLSDNGWAFGVYGLETPGGTPDSPKVLRDFTGMRVRDRFAQMGSRRPH